MDRIINADDYSHSAQMVLADLWQNNNTIHSSMINNPRDLTGAKELYHAGIIVQHNGMISLAPDVTVVAQWTNHDVSLAPTTYTLTADDCARYTEITYTSNL